MTVGTSNLVIFVIAIILVVGIIALILNKTFFKQLVIKYRGRTEEIARQDAATPRIISIMQSEKKKLYMGMQNVHMLRLLEN